MWYVCPRRILLAASNRFIGFVTYENTPPFFVRQSTTFGYTSYKNERFLYEYNFHVNWQIEIRLEETDTLTADCSYPLCIGGKRAAPPEDCGGPAHFNQLRAYFSPFYIYHQLLDGYEMYQRRDQLSEEEQYEFEVRQQEISRFSYWAKVDKFDRRTANKRLKLYAAGNDNWMAYEEVSW